MRASFITLVSVLALSAGCDLLSSLSPPADEPPTSRRPGREGEGEGEARCTDNGDCQGGELCEDGTCLRVCEVDGDCDGGQSCLEGRCRTPGCIVDGDCPGGFGCDNNTCVGLVACTDGAVRCVDAGTLGRCVLGSERLEDCPGRCEASSCVAAGEGEGEGEGEPAAGLSIQLTWSTSTDDLDLHLSRAFPATFCTADDCTYNNRTPSWGARMDIDDLQGFGPERISYANPADGLYTVLVDGFKLDATSTATVRVLVDGQLAFEASRSLRDADHWLVAGITVDNGVASFVTADRIQQQQGDCLSDVPSTTTACTVDSTCAATEFCNTATERCAVGCRSTANCSANQTCNANHACVANAGTGGHNDPCATTTDCTSGLTCNLLLGTCTEPCTTDSTCDLCTAEAGLPCSCVEFITGAGFCMALGQ